MTRISEVAHCMSLCRNFEGLFSTGMGGRSKLLYAYTEYANCKDGVNVQRIDEDKFLYGDSPSDCFFPAR
jgi:hypothetical protein